jgi:transcriptional regulator with XRE-family HTH domain
MPERFGEALRRHRRKAGKTLGDLARLLGVSVVYVSDVERGNRRPLSNERILRVADFLDADPTPLIDMAARERGVIEYDITKARPLEADVVGGLVSGLARGGVTDKQLHEIQRILTGGEDGDD